MLLGATGTGKSATTAWLVEKLQRPTLVMAPNKTLAAQLANEFRELLARTTPSSTSSRTTTTTNLRPTSRRRDTYIEKDSSINEEVERLRHSATNALLTRRDCIVVATVSRHLRTRHPAGVRRPHGAAAGRESTIATSCCGASSRSSTRATTSPSRAARSECGATPLRFPGL